MILNFLDNIILVLMISALATSFFVALRLYKNAPENPEMGFNKYLNAMMMDVSFSKRDKNLLIFEGERLETFLKYRKFILTSLVMIFLSGFVLLFNSALTELGIVI